MSDVLYNVSIMDDDDNIVTELRIAIPPEDAAQFVSDFEEHFIANYDEAELL